MSFQRSSIDVDDIITKSPWVDIRAFGAHRITESGYENFDSTTAIQNAINQSYKVLISGIYKISNTLDITEGVYDFTDATIKQTVNLNVLNMLGSHITINGGIIDVTEVTNFTKAAMFFGNSDNEYITINNSRLIGKKFITDCPVEQNADFFTEFDGGKAIYFEKTTSSTTSYYSVFTTFNDVMIEGFGCGIQMSVGAQYSTSTFPWITEVKFNNFVIAYSAHALNISNNWIQKCYFEGSIQCYSAQTGKYWSILNGDHNIFKLIFWDTDKKCAKIMPGSHVKYIINSDICYLDDFGATIYLNSNVRPERKFTVNDKYPLYLYVDEASTCIMERIKENGIPVTKISGFGDSVYLGVGGANGVYFPLKDVKKIRTNITYKSLNSAQIQTATLFAPRMSAIYRFNCGYFKYLYTLDSIDSTRTAISVSDATGLTIGDSIVFWGESSKFQSNPYDFGYTPTEAIYQITAISGNLLSINKSLANTITANYSFSKIILDGYALSDVVTTSVSNSNYVTTSSTYTLPTDSTTADLFLTGVYMASLNGLTDNTFFIKSIEVEFIY